MSQGATEFMSHFCLIFVKNVFTQPTISAVDANLEPIVIVNGIVDLVPLQVSSINTFMSFSLQHSEILSFFGVV